MAAVNAVPEHRIDVTRGERLRRRPQSKMLEDQIEFRKQVEQNSTHIRPSKRRIAMMLYLATDGWTPWGVKLYSPAALSLCGREYIMCCGHVMKEKEAQQFVDAGLLMDGPRDRFNRPTLVITEAGREWLNQAW